MMSAAAPAKFKFDVDMSGHRENASVMSERKLAAMLEAAHREGFDEGHKAGATSAEIETQRAFQHATENLVRQAAQLANAMDGTHRDAIGQAALVGQSIGQKLATHLVARFPQAELSALIAECMTSLGEAPHLVIRCHPDLADPIKAIAEQNMTTSGFSGRLVVMGEPDIALGDGRLEWADGGLIRDSAKIADEVDTVISAWLNSQADPALKETDQ